MSCHGAGRWARTARYSGCSKKPWRGGFSRRRSGKPGTVSSQPQWTARVHIRWRAEVSRLMVPVAAPAARRVSWYWRIWYVVSAAARASRPKQAARWAVPATGGADGPELPDLVVLEVGVAELSQGRPLGAERARRRCRRVGGTGGAGRAGLVRGHGIGPSCVAAAGRRRPSTFALVGRTGKGNVRRRRDGERKILGLRRGSGRAPCGALGDGRTSPGRLPYDRASWRGSRHAGRGRHPRWRWLGVRRRSARSRRARIGTGAGTGTVSRRGCWPPGAPRGALVRHPVAGVPSRVSRVAPGHGARAVARHRPIDALRSHQTSGVELARPPHEPPCSGPPIHGQGACPGWHAWIRERPSAARPSPESGPVTCPPRGRPRAGDLYRAGEVRVSRW